LKPIGYERRAGRALTTLLFAAACNSGAPAKDAGQETEKVATLLLVQGLEEEGGIVGRTMPNDTAVVAFFRDHVVFADARLVTEYLAPKTRVEAVAGTLRLDGRDTGIPVEMRGSLSFVPLKRLAEHFRAYTRIEESPGRMASVWRHDVVCRYARDADRRAAVFLEAAEHGILRQCDPPITAEVRRWANALPSEHWAASVTLNQALDSTELAALLGQYGAAPYAAYGVVAGHHLIVRVGPDSASLHVIKLLRTSAIEALERGLCGLADALNRRGRGAVLRSRARGEDPFHGERHMLASALAARRELPRVRAGEAIVSGVDVIANVAELRRLAANPRVRRFDPATRLDDGWVLPGAELSGGVTVPSDVLRLDSAALFTRLEAEAERAATECRERH
jgi:hypothetical protein